ncbi:MAG: HAMP domain-containing protein [Nitrospirae bacterium]|nr:HAMP domain-containing protein [Nitrospirota bacterium]
MREYIIKENFKEVDRLAKQLGLDSTTRVTIIFPNGKVIADTYNDPERMDNHINRIEVQEALSKGTGTSIRYSNTMKVEMMYASYVLTENNKVLAIIRTSVSASTIKETLFHIYLQLIGGVFLLIVLITIISLYISKRISRRLVEMKQQSQRISDGDFSLKFQFNDSDSVEIAEMGRAIENMAEQLLERFRIIELQKEEQDMVFSSMMEGLLVIGHDKRIINMNKSFASLLDINLSRSIGLDVSEVIKIESLLEFIESAFVSNVPIEKDIEILRIRKIFHVYGKPFKPENSNKIGMLLVLNDYTRLKHLERHRKEFVANVSHELKTPITSIKGFVETLTQNALSKEETDKFLTIILRQSNRLNSIIDDLLSLSELERYSETSGLQLENASVRNVLIGAVSICRERAKDMNIDLIMECDEAIYGYLNSHLLEQAVVNLIDNAIKYSEQGTVVHVSAYKISNKVVVQVKDNGIGIGFEHLSRIFERFYRIDKGRSRKMGGTGLGLSIVKHIAEVHGGIAKVESELGKGSTFSISLRAGE